jgi:prepilin-type N-terminal cleavage/methylation domain-containing protein
MIAKLLKKTDEGFTLIELMAAMVILTFGVVAALQILVEAHKSNNFARAKTMAVNRAEEQMEWIYQIPSYDDFAFNALNDSWFAVGDLVGAGPNGEPGHITVVDSDPRVVTITVDWQGQGTLHEGHVLITAFRSKVSPE